MKYVFYLYMQTYFEIETLLKVIIPQGQQKMSITSLTHMYIYIYIV